MSGALDGSSTRRTMPVARAPRVYAASTRSRRVAPTMIATISTIWKNEPMKMTISFCASPIPAHRMSSGMNAEAGRYRANETNGSKNASIGLYAPIAIPSGTPIAAAIAKPPTTRQIVIPMSRWNPCMARSRQPDSSMVNGSARNVLETNPPSVAIAQAARKSTKNAMPSAIFTPRVTGVSGFIANKNGPGMRGRASWVPTCGRTGARPSLDETDVDDRVDVGHALDDAELEQELPCLAAESLDLTREEPAIGLAVLPAKVPLRFLELLAGLLHDRAHDLEALLRLALDQLERLEVARHEGLHELRVLLDELGRAAEGVHDHRIVERRRDDLAGVGFVAHRRQVPLVGHRRIVLPGDEGLRRRPGFEVDDLHVLHREPVLLEHPGEREIRRRAGRRSGHGLALELPDPSDAVAHDHAVGAVRFVQLHDLLDRDPVRVPHDEGLHRRRRALDVAGCDGEVPVLLRNELDRHVDAVLLEDACLVGERERRKARPPAHADRHLGQVLGLRTGAERKHHGKHRDETSHANLSGSGLGGDCRGSVLREATSRRCCEAGHRTGGRIAASCPTAAACR